MKKWRECESGFTLVEMIITIAISAILVGASAAAFGYISSGNAKRSAARFNSHLNTAQTETMMKDKTTYLYLYKDSDGVKSVLSESNYQSRAQLDTGVANDRQSDVGGAGVDVVATADDGSTYTLNNTNTMIKIAFYKASGAYRYSNAGSDADARFFSEIKFSGRENYKVTLVKMTGKHVMNK